MDAELDDIKADMKKLLMKNNTRYGEMRRLQREVLNVAVADISTKLAEEFVDKVVAYNTERMEIF